MGMGKMTPEVPKEIIDFLEINGFKKAKDKRDQTIWNTYKNDLCIIYIDMDKEYYKVTNNEGWSMYSDNLVIYWLIGVLTYNNLMDKNYKTLKNE